MFEQDVAIVGRALKTKLWRADEPGQHEKWTTLLGELATFHGMAPVPNLSIQPDSTPHYEQDSNTIVLDKYSLISFLFVFGALVGFHPAVFSHDVFKRAYPTGWAKLQMDDRGYMVKPELTHVPPAIEEAFSGDALPDLPAFDHEVPVDDLPREGSEEP